MMLQNHVKNKKYCTLDKLMNETCSVVIILYSITPFVIRDV